MISIAKLLDSIPTVPMCGTCKRALRDCECNVRKTKPTAAVLLDDLPPNVLDLIRKDRVELND